MPSDSEALRAAWEAGHAAGWADAQDAHDVRQTMERSDWKCSPNPYKEEPPR